VLGVVAGCGCGGVDSPPKDLDVGRVVVVIIDLMLMKAMRQQQGNIPVCMLVCDVSLYGLIHACM
jgi:hypothetical protein